MQKRWKWATWFLAAVVLILGVWFFPRELPNERKLKVENFPKVSVGMTLAEVEELLGGPEGNYGLRPKGTEMMSSEGSYGSPETGEKIWVNENNRFEIVFDSTNRVIYTHKRASYRQLPPPESYFVRSWRAMRAYFGF